MSNVKKNILVIGSGGREHAIINTINKSNRVGDVYALPGNAGINQEAKAVEGISVNDFQSVAKFCKTNNIDFVIVGPEQPLVDGIVDFLENEGIKIFGPNKLASQVEGSKEFMKNLVAKYDIPTAKYRSFTDPLEAIKYINEHGAPIVVKTDGLAAGKGVTVAMTLEDAIHAIDEAFEGKFGDAGKKVVIEDFLEGEEASFFVMTDGKTAIQLGSAQDHKAAYDGDKGPNTGGMGTYSPAPLVDKKITRRIMERIINPTLQAMKSEGIDYKGFLFAGLMIDQEGNPNLIEYNIRFGDPEAQVILPRIESDFIELIEKALDEKLEEVEEVKFSKNHHICVVMAAKGYPGSYDKGSKIDLLATTSLENVKIFHAGTKLDVSGNLISNGGRVLNITASDKNLKNAAERAYGAISKIDYEDSFYRSDIGWRVLQAEKEVLAS